ncbi:MAG: hypothetical protein L6Q37_02575 [Bdellovibrionaceae bacterium]|nr:hypothetical protein [Pseudobdellovibrionaceae bacterium]NUM58720.1 hypothetical protein [Pseudobdellovibrionaceae bacterium]
MKFKYKIVIIFFCFFSTVKAEKKLSNSKLDYKKFIYGYSFSGFGPTWSEHLCKSLDYNSLKPFKCKKANDNIGNKSIRCSLAEKSLILAAYLTIDDCKRDLQMSTEGDNS